MTLQKTTKIISILLIIVIQSLAQTYKIVDTGQTKYFNNTNEISTPVAGQNFYGQDAQYNGNQPSYTDNNDGTITDNVTGLMWSKSPDLNGDGTIDANDKLTYADALASADTVTFAGYNDWRLPTIKEQYSLIMFSGLDPSGYNGSTENIIPFIDTEYFDFGFGDESAGERIIDAQFATSTQYVSTTMNGNETMFGVNFADGRIKGYPSGPTPIDSDGKGFYVLYVRGNADYGKNDFQDNNDGTITDKATGLMWMQSDNGEAISWEGAMEYAENFEFAGYADWRLPNVKELQSIVDYTRSPATTNSPAIDPMFSCSKIIDEGGNDNYPFYWSSTTHENMVSGSNAAYVAFGEGLGWMSDPMGYNYTLMDVHGAGCQRSDPKNGDPADYPYGHGPQGDVIRIYNYVRLVRDADTSTDMDESSIIPKDFQLKQNYPNPFNPTTTIEYSLPSNETVEISVFDIMGKKIKTLINSFHTIGNYQVQWNGDNNAGNIVSSGLYFYQVKAGGFIHTRKMNFMK